MTKTLTFACVHFTVAFTVGYLLTGSVVIGGAIALVEPACNTFAYYWHERIWQGIERRKQLAEIQENSAAQNDAVAAKT